MKSASYQQALWKAMKKFLDSKYFASVPVKGSSRWSARYIVLTSILMSLAGSKYLSDAFALARQALVSIFPQRRPGDTYQGFVSYDMFKALIERRINFLMLGIIFMLIN